MAIEFNCPNCSAMIRVPDTAGGGKGKCPRCARRIAVPKVSTKAPPKPPAPELEGLFAPPEPEEPADPDEILFVEAETEEPDVAAGPVDFLAPRPLGELPVAPPRQALKPGSVASRLKKKQSGGAWLIPVAFGLLLCAGVGWYVWQQYQTVRLAGELTAETAATLELPPVELPGAYFKQAPDEMKTVMAELESSPVTIGSASMQVVFGATKRAVTIQLNAGPQASFFRVDTGGHQGLANYRKEHAFKLDEALEEQLEQAATEFADDYLKVKSKKQDPRALNAFLNRLALPALARGLGQELVAVYGQTIYPCVYEDRDGGLYFLLPPKAREFDVSGRKHKNGTIVFPGKFHIKVAGEIRRSAEKKAEPADKSSSKPDMPEGESPEMKDATDETPARKQDG